MEVKKYPLITCSKQPGSDIIYAECNKNLSVDLEAAKEMVANRLDFMMNENHYLVLDFSNIKYFTREAKVYMQNPEAGSKNILGGAFIASNPVSALLANIFIKTLKDVPSKFFFNKKDAVKWIEELKQKHQQPGNMN